jgi:hypothetical protein
VLALGRLEKAWIHGLVGFFATQHSHSALGGDVVSTDWARGQHWAMMVGYPLATLKDFLEICLFVVALVTTKNLLDMVVQTQRPNIIAALRGIAPRTREVLLLSLKYMVALVGLAGAPLLLASYLVTSERFREFATSKACLFVFGLVAEGCIAWLLIPSVLRLLRSPGGPEIAVFSRRVGTFFAVATSAASFALEYLVGKAETTVMVDSRWEGEAIAVVSTIIINSPEVFLFIALALLAAGEARKDVSLAMNPETI